MVDARSINESSSISVGAGRGMSKRGIDYS